MGFFLLPSTRVIAELILSVGAPGEQLPPPGITPRTEEIAVGRIVWFDVVPIQAVIKLEEALDSFRPHEELNRLLMVRCLMAEYLHRSAGGRSEAEAFLDVSRYLAAFRQAGSLALANVNLPALQALHATIAGRPEPTPVRVTPIAMRANMPGARLRATGAAPADILGRLEELNGEIIRNPALGRFEKIALGNFEFMRTHPFDDGNGRVGRLVLTALLASEFQSHIFLGITHVIRTNFRRYNGMIRDKSEDVYVKWVLYLSGLLTAEAHAARRFDASLRNLSSSDRGQLLARTGELVDAVQDGGESMSATIQGLSGGVPAGVATLITGLFS
jgi:hypothetical protein